MGNLFTAGEIVRLGILIEKNGREFYAAVAAQSQDKKVKEVFEYLAGEETKHEKLFESMLPQMREYEPPESASEEYNEYMQALAGEHVFVENGKGKEAAAGVKNAVEALDFALDFEKDSILMFHEMKQFVPEEEHKAIDRLIAEEQRHVIALVKIKSEI